MTQGASHAAVIVELIEGIFRRPRRPSPESRLLLKISCVCSRRSFALLASSFASSLSLLTKWVRFLFPPALRCVGAKKTRHCIPSSVVAGAAQFHPSMPAPGLRSREPRAGTEERTDGDGHEDCRQTRITPMTQLVTKWEREGQKLCPCRCRCQASFLS